MVPLYFQRLVYTGKSSAIVANPHDCSLFERTSSFLRDARW